MPVIEIRVPEGYGARWSWRQPIATTLAADSSKAEAAALKTTVDAVAPPADADGTAKATAGDSKDKADGAASTAGSDAGAVAKAETPTKASTRGSAESSSSGDEADLVFRGFLEPHMADGHDKGWRH